MKRRYQLLLAVGLLALLGASTTSIDRYERVRDGTFASLTPDSSQVDSTAMTVIPCDHAINVSICAVCTAAGETATIGVVKWKRVDPSTWVAKQVSETAVTIGSTATLSDTVTHFATTVAFDTAGYDGITFYTRGVTGNGSIQLNWSMH